MIWAALAGLALAAGPEALVAELSVPPGVRVTADATGSAWRFVVEAGRTRTFEVPAPLTDADRASVRALVESLLLDLDLPAIPEPPAPSLPTAPAAAPRSPEAAPSPAPRAPTARSAPIRSEEHIPTERALRTAPLPRPASTSSAPGPREARLPAPLEAAVPVAPVSAAPTTMTPATMTPATMTPATMTPGTTALRTTAPLASAPGTAPISSSPRTAPPPLATPEREAAPPDVRAPGRTRTLPFEPWLAAAGAVRPGVRVSPGVALGASLPADRLDLTLGFALHPPRAISIAKDASFAERTIDLTLGLHPLDGLRIAAGPGLAIRDYRQYDRRVIRAATPRARFAAEIDRAVGRWQIAAGLAVDLDLAKSMFEDGDDEALLFPVTAGPIVRMIFRTPDRGAYIGGPEARDDE